MNSITRRSIMGVSLWLPLIAQQKSSSRWHDRLKALSDELAHDGHANVSRAMKALALTFKYGNSSVKINQTITDNGTTWSVYVKVPSNESEV